MSQTQVINFSSNKESFSLNMQDCLKILPISNVDIIDNKALSRNIENLQYFILVAKELVPVFDLPKYSDINQDEKMKNIYILIVSSNNKKVGLRVSINEISLYDTNAQVLDMQDLLSGIGY